MAFPTYPVELDRKTWKKAKGTLTGSTGVGEELEAIKLQFDKITSQVFTDLAAAKTKEEIEKQKKLAESEKQRLVKLQQKLTKFVSFLNTKISEMKKSKTTPAKTRKALEDMVPIAQKLAVAITDYPDEVVLAADKLLSELNGGEEKPEPKKTEEDEDDKPEVDKALATELKACASAERNFVIAIGKQSALVMTKQAIGPAHRTAAKEKSGGAKKMIDGSCIVEKGVHVFIVDSKPPAGVARSLKQAAFNQAKMNIKVKLRWGNEEIDADNDAPSVDTDEPEISQPLSSGGEDLEAYNTRKAEITPLLKQVLGTEGVDPNPIKAAFAEAEKFCKAQNYARGIKSLDTLEKLSKTALALSLSTDFKAGDTSKTPEKDVAGARTKFDNRVKALKADYEKAVAQSDKKISGRLKGLHTLAHAHADDTEFKAATEALDTLSVLITQVLSGQMFDEDAAPYESRKDEVEPAYEKARHLDTELEKLFKQAESQAKAKDYKKAIKTLDALEKQSVAAFVNLGREWRVRVKAFQPYRKMAERLVELTKKLESEDLNVVEISPEERQKIIEHLTKQQQAGVAIMELFEAAQELTSSDTPLDEWDLNTANAKLDQAERLAKSADEEMKQAQAEIEQQTKAAAQVEAEAFDFASKIKDKDWGFDPDSDGMNFLLGNAPDETGTLVMSPKLKAMNEAMAAAVKRKDKLMALGADPEEAGRAAFANIPEALWPDSYVKEVLMFRRAEEAIAMDKAEEEAELINKAVENLEKVETGINQVTAIQEKFKDLTPEDAKELADICGECADSFGLALDGVEVVTSGVTAVKSVFDAKQVDEDDPVAKKVAEFKRNKALLELADKLVELGLEITEKVLSEACPWFGAVAKGKEMVVEIAKAAKYFAALAETEEIRKGAKRDPKSMMALPLANAARNQGLKASKATMKAIAAGLEATGKTLEGVGEPEVAAAGLVIDLTGKLVKGGTIIVFKSIKFSDAKKAQGTLKKAKGPPPNRKAMAMVFKDHNKYAKYALAYGATEGNDPWARAYLISMNLTDREIDNPNTSIKIVREYLQCVDEADLEMETLGDKVSGSGTVKAMKKGGDKLAKGAEALSDKIVGRDTSAKYEEEFLIRNGKPDPDSPNPDFWKPPQAELSHAAWKTVKADAIKAGWYDDRGGLGKILDNYTKAEQAYAAQESDIQKALAELGTTKPEEKIVLKMIADVGAAIAAVDMVGEVAMSITPTANDKVTPHAGMQKYLFSMKAKCEQQAAGWKPTREKLYDLLSFDPQQGGTVEEQKQARIDKDMEEMRDAQSKKVQEREKDISDWFSDFKFETPFGTCKLTAFTKLANEKLNLTQKGKDALGTALAVVYQAKHHDISELLAGVPDDKLKKEFDRNMKSMSAKLKDELRELCTGIYKKNAEEPVEFKWFPTGINLSHSSWSKNKKGAIADGMQDESTGIGKAFTELDAASKDYHKKKLEIDARKVENALDALADAFKKFKPLHKANKLGYTPMEEYIGFMLEEIAKYRGEFKNGPPVEFEPGPFDFSDSSWQAVKKLAIKKGLLSKKDKTGLGASLKASKKAMKAWANSTPEKGETLAHVFEDFEIAAERARTAVNETITIASRLKQDAKHASFKAYMDGCLKQANAMIRMLSA